MITAKTTHKQVLKHRMHVTKGEICNLLNLTPDAYEILRYDLAIAWLEYQEYFESTARLFILSKTFFNWWYQRLYSLDCSFLQAYSKSHNTTILRDKYMNKALTLSFRPSKTVMESIRKEGLAALERNPNLKTSKVFAV
ncbi:MAG: hypothetical protein KAS32_02035 [Candidatus Peribacteraceae bacterium]|nr:hypothetical protein [Candidatus Peribacteraceae bacterium]